MSDIGDRILVLKNSMALSDESGRFISAAIDLAARVARAGLTPEAITLIDVAALRERLVADARLDARAERHDRGIPPSDRTPDRRATMPADDAPASAYVGDVYPDDPPEPKP